MTLFTWHELNKKLRTLKTEAAVKELIEAEEKQQMPRPRWLKRMWARFRQLRYQREKKELNGLPNPAKGPRSKPPERAA